MASKRGPERKANEGAKNGQYLEMHNIEQASSKIAREINNDGSQFRSHPLQLLIFPEHTVT
jgi:hypothetical protein